MKSPPCSLNTWLPWWLRPKEGHPLACHSCPKQVKAGGRVDHKPCSQSQVSHYSRGVHDSGGHRNNFRASPSSKNLLLLRGRTAGTNACTRNGERAESNSCRWRDRGESLQEQTWGGKGYSPGAFILLLFLQLAGTIRFWSSSSSIHGWEYCNFLSLLISLCKTMLQW